MRKFTSSILFVSALFSISFQSVIAQPLAPNPILPVTQFWIDYSYGVANIDGTSDIDYFDEFTFNFPYQFANYGNSGSHRCAYFNGEEWVTIIGVTPNTTSYTKKFYRNNSPAPSPVQMTCYKGYYGAVVSDIELDWYRPEVNPDANGFLSGQYTAPGVYDLFAFQSENTYTGKVEVTKFANYAGWKEITFHTPIYNLPVGTGYKFQILENGTNDLIVFKTEDTPSGKVEAYAYSASSNWQQRYWSAELPLDAGSEYGYQLITDNFGGGGAFNLLVFKTKNTSSGKVEATFLSKASGWQQVYHSMTLNLSTQFDYVFDTEPVSGSVHDLFVFQTGGDPNQKVKAMMFSASSGWQTKNWEGVTGVSYSNLRGILLEKFGGVNYRLVSLAQIADYPTYNIDGAKVFSQESGWVNEVASVPVPITALP